MEDIRPTAKWANRMLRPLTSIYHRLEKHHEIVTSVLISKAKEKQKSSTAPAAGRTRSSTNGVRDRGCSYSDDEEPNDPAWIPGQLDKRRIRHSYSSRGRGDGVRRRSRLLIRSPEIPKTLPGAIEIATPLITGKLRGPLTEVSPSLRVQLFQSQLSIADNGGSSEHRKRGRANNSSFPPYQGSWKEVLHRSGDPRLVDIAHLLDRIFLKFLKTTRTGPGEGARGARSLLSMAVRRLPEFIAEEQRIQDETEEGCEVDMCDAYFTELEASYAPSGHGWQPLREAVRAQGIYLVSCMIQNQRITSAAALRLLEECLSQEEFDAFESLMTICLENIDTYHYPTAFDHPRQSSQREDAISILGKYYLKSPKRRAYVLEALSTLLVRGAIPPEWMVTTHWKRCVDSAIKSVSTEDCNYMSARRLIESVILSSAGIYSTANSNAPRHCHQIPLTVRTRDTRASSQIPGLKKDQNACPIPIQDALSNLVASLITALCGMCIARSQAADAQERLAGLKTREIINSLAYMVQRTVGDGPQPDGPAFHLLRRGYVLLADCTIQCGQRVTVPTIYHSDSVSKQNIEAFFRILAFRQDVVKELAGLVSQVFHHSEHAHGQGPLRAPREIRARVSHLPQLASASGVALLLGRVVAEVAMDLAEKSLDPDDHAWAVEMQEMAFLSQQDEGSQDSSPSTIQPYSSLYRWEDSIGEWVARTPEGKPRTVTANVALKQQSARRGPSRFTIPCSTDSSSASSICSEKSTSTVTSSAPSIPKKRSSASQGRSPRPLKKTYHTRSVEQIGDKSSDWVNIPDRSQCKPFVEATEVPVAARTRTRPSQGENARAGNTPVGSVSKIEVVIVNKGMPAAPLRYHPEPSRRRSARHSSILPQKSYRIARRRQSAPVPVTHGRITIPCSEDDNSDDELSFF
ncbi:hypothetical protein BJY01DRAFT_223520 [Aspergillus pseudoustus]|uniref:Wings apart-like protein regulation of heterochromatin-domain-containing protein n=1 Tax=Aspergillus pseudoustus TaxID=1810923 RepID=A0ABR4J8Z7_9EURO